MIVVGMALVSLATFIDTAPGNRSNIGNALNVLMYLMGIGVALLGFLKMLGV
jgi:hypothetical protein